MAKPNFKFAKRQKELAKKKKKEEKRKRKLARSMDSDQPEDFDESSDDEETDDLETDDVDTDNAEDTEETKEIQA
jgi:hypothetical protein